MTNKQMYCDYCGELTQVFDRLLIEHASGKPTFLDLCLGCGSKLSKEYEDKKSTNAKLPRPLTTK